MAEYHPNTAVGAGTVAGDAIDEECTTESRAAQAVEDALLESVRTSGAAPTGVPSEVEVLQVETGNHRPAGARPAEHRFVAEARDDLKLNQAGIGSRMEK
jgi:hypothetical protein